MQIFLHLGAAKTGTTSVQYFLKKNRNKLLTQNILYPTSMGEDNHLELYKAFHNIRAEKRFAFDNSFCSENDRLNYIKILKNKTLQEIKNNKNIRFL